MKKKTWLIILSVFLLIVASALIFAPGIAKNYVVKNSKELIGRQIALDKIRVNYLTGTTKLYHFKMFEADSRTTFVSFDTLILNLAPYKFITNNLVIQQLYLQGLQTNIQQNDTVFNFDDLIAFYQTRPDTTLPDTSANQEPFRFELADFELKDANIRYHDLVIDKVWTMNDLNFFVPYVSWDQEESSEAGLRFKFKNDGFFQASINADPQQGDFDAHIRISKLYLDNFTDYAKKYLDISSLDGKFNTNINIVGNLSHPEKAVVSGMVNVEDFVSTDVSGKPFINIPNLSCYLGRVDAGNMDFIIDSVSITSPWVYFDLNDSTNNFFEVINYEDYLAEDEKAVAEGAADYSDTAVRVMYAINQVSIQGGNVEFMERYTGETYEYQLSDLNIRAKNITSESGSKDDGMDAIVDFVLNDQTPVKSAIKAEINEGAFEADVELENLDVTGFSGYVTDYLNIDAFYGSVNSDVKVTGNLYRIDEAVVSGMAEAHQLQVTDEYGWQFFSLDTLQCYFTEIDSHNMEFMFDSVFLIRPYVYFDRYDSTNNFFEILGYEYQSGDTLNGMGDSQTPEVESFDYSYAFNYLSIRDGILDFVDNTTSEPFLYLLSDMEMTADSITTETNWVETYAKMLLNHRGDLTAQVGFDPANPMDIKLNYVISDFLLSDLNIYSRHYMGFPILYGDMYYKSETSILDGQLESENELVIENVELGNKQGGLYNLPIRFALFLLKDRNGVINLDVPVRGDLNDPRVNIGKIVWNTLKNLIVKVAASPVDFLSGILQVDPNDIKAIEFAYMDTTFTAYRQRQLDLLMELEQKKQGLDIEMVYFNDLEKEKAEIAVAEAGKLFEISTGKNHLENQDAFIDFLQTETQSDSVNIIDASRMLVPLLTIDSIAEVFAQKRMDMLTGYIKSVNDSSRIKTFVPPPAAPKNVGSKPIFEIKYSMK